MSTARTLLRAGRSPRLPESVAELSNGRPGDPDGPAHPLRTVR
ncbi:hypothetical protein SFR_1531 [Streptomyces sp. FR-008]|nr:hypothetical protein SFR_1531 [Streptomyces sp. FR-008]